MFAVPTRVALAAALAAGAALALPTAAAAAPKQPCAVGKWKLTQYKLDSRSEGYTAKAKGGEGTRLTITKKTVTYDFNRSKKVVTKGVLEGEAYSVTSVFRKTLKMKSTLRGNKKGGILLNVQSASGNAKVAETANGKYLGSHSIVKTYRKGETDPFIPPAAFFTCGAKTLKLVLEADGGDSTLDAVYVYKRG
ncbi:hypothetical protein ABGB12_06920 [Actinocorallia sp. B10E7]|uniref:hypothetical protein n=1 Tax=Actinocorallia sp. B10E7 TaxID=3153558 RepID=UPI00325D198B